MQGSPPQENEMGKSNIKVLCMYGQLQRKQMHLKNILQSFQISTLFKDTKLM